MPFSSSMHHGCGHHGFGHSGHSRFGHHHHGFHLGHHHNHHHSHHGFHDHSVFHRRHRHRHHHHHRGGMDWETAASTIGAVAALTGVAMHAVDERRPQRPVRHPATAPGAQSLPMARPNVYIAPSAPPPRSPQHIPVAVARPIDVTLPATHVPMAEAAIIPAEYTVPRSKPTVVPRTNVVATYPTAPTAKKEKKKQRFARWFG